MAEGRKGAGPYSKNYADFTHPADFGEKDSGTIATEEFKRACNPWDHDTWKPGVVSSSPKKGGRGNPDVTDRPVAAYSPTGKYAKKGGSGQRSGS